MARSVTEWAPVTVVLITCRRLDHIKVNDHHALTYPTLIEDSFFLAVITTRLLLTLIRSTAQLLNLYYIDHPTYNAWP